MTTNKSESMCTSRLVPIAAVVLAAVALAACETGSNALTGNASTSPPLNAPVSPPTPQPPQTKISIAPVIGAPDQVGRSLSQEMAGQIAKQKAVVVAAGERSDYTLRGYIVAAKEKANTKVSYIWDVTDSSGKRLNRITGEEVVAGQAPKDPWTAVSPTVITTIAQKSATSLGAWLPTAPASTGAAPIAATGAAPVETASVGATATAAAAATTGVRSQPQASPAATPSAAPGNSAAMTAAVPSVTGAPGDGATSLAQALQSELSKSGVTVGPANSPTAYRVEGVVKMSSAQAGRQAIQIDWNVKDPQGKKLGTVSQKNEIPEGSLDGAWGSTAGAAAAAAAQGILKLLPR